MVLVPPVTMPRYELFTDGSAINNKCPFLRLCSWAVTYAHDDGPRNTTLCAGILPGRRQTVFRAEFQAVNAAIASVPSANIYTDNQAVAGIVHQLLVNGYGDERWITHPDRDLIHTCARLLSGKQRNAISISWVRHTERFSLLAVTMIFGLSTTMLRLTMQQRSLSHVFRTLYS